MASFWAPVKENEEQTENKTVAEYKIINVSNVEIVNIVSFKWFINLNCLNLNNNPYLILKIIFERQFTLQKTKKKSLRSYLIYMKYEEKYSFTFG